METEMMNGAVTRKIGEWLWVGLLASTWGCGATKEKDDPVDPMWGTDTDAAEGGQITNLTADEGASAPDDGGVDETGDVLVEDACLLGPKAGFFGYAHQCGGYVEIIFGASVGDPPFTSADAFDFGQGIEGDFYAAPKVMACCDPFDYPYPEGTGFWDQPHGKACVADLIEQGCKSFVFYIQDASEQLPVHLANQAVELSNWIASEEGQTQCRDEFWVMSGASDATEHVHLPLWGWTWFPTPADPEDNKWPAIVDPFVTIDDTQVLEIYPTQEDDEDLRECFSANDNDDIVFVVAESDTTATRYKLANGSASLSGPQHQGLPISGSGTLASSATSCTTCSRASTVPAGSNLRLQTLDLRSASAVNVGTSTQQLNLERYRVALYESVLATRISANVYRVPAGADVLLSTTIAGERGHIVSARTSSAITITVGTSTTSMSQFRIGYTDVSGAAWTMTVNATTWSRP